MSVNVFAPASIGNVSVGFDVLGLAVRPIDGTLLGDVVKVVSSTSDKSDLSVVGQFADKLPAAKEDNIVWDCLKLFNRALDDAGITVEHVEIGLDKKMPVGSGLGSSACSVVATLVALNEFYNKPFADMPLLKMMGEMEAQISGSLHYDNVAPCFLGGLQLMLPDQEQVTRQLPFFEDCYWVMAYPGIEVSTKMAREVLPEKYTRQDLIATAQNLATFVDGCHRQDKKQAFNAMQDKVAEPYREPLLPRYTQAKAHMDNSGALASGISGSGPTLFAVFDNLKQAEQMANWLKLHYLQSDLGFVHVCHADQEGACVV